MHDESSTGRYHPRNRELLWFKSLDQVLDRISVFDINAVIIRCLIITIALTAQTLATADAQELESGGESGLSYQQEPNYDEVSTGTFFLRSEQTVIDAPILKSAVKMTISGVVANVIMSQQFTNDSTDWVEGIYAFPLPANAAINGLTIRIADRTIEGRINRIQEAQALYREAKADGKVAGLITQHRPNLFTTRVANIPPGTNISVELTYLQEVLLRDDRYRIRLPTTLTPRFRVGNPTQTLANQQALSPPQFHSLVDAENIPMLNLPSMDVHAVLHGDVQISELNSPTHSVMVQDLDGTLDIRLSKTTAMDQDFILDWTSNTSKLPKVSTWLENIDGDDYLLAVVDPPHRSATTVTNVDRELILTLDTSGSMAGASMAAARQASMVALNGLRSADRFNIITFNDTTKRLFQSSVHATPENLNRARRLVSGLQAGGGTQMQPALASALSNPITEYLRQVVFVTDGSVDNEEQLFTQISQQLRAARLFTVGIGTAPNTWFMNKSAAIGRGTSTFIRDVDDAQKEMTSLFRILEFPSLTDISLNWQNGNADVTPSPIADLYLGEPLVIAAKLEPGTTGFTISGNLGNEQWQSSVNLNNVIHVNTGLSTLWARRKIDSLLDLQRRSGSNTPFKSTITKLALTHKLVSPYTSFVAVENTPVRAQAHSLLSKQVPNLMPSGSLQAAPMSMLSMPQGSAGRDTLLLISLIALLLFTTLLFSRIRPLTISVKEIR